MLHFEYKLKHVCNRLAVFNDLNYHCLELLQPLLIMHLHWVSSIYMVLLLSVNLWLSWYCPPITCYYK